MLVTASWSLFAIALAVGTYWQKIGKCDCLFAGRVLALNGCTFAFRKMPLPVLKLSCFLQRRSASSMLGTVITQQFWSRIHLTGEQERIWYWSGHSIFFITALGINPLGTFLRTTAHQMAL